MQEIIVYDSEGNSLSNLVQWDVDVNIYINHENIDKAYPVHFFNQTMDEAFVVNSSTYENGALKVKIPNDLLVQPYPVIGYVNIEKNSENRCLYGFKINIRKKPKPSNLVYKESNDYIAITKILDECKGYASTASMEAASAISSALLAKSYAEGNTGIRENENTNNSKYYYEQSLTKANEANTSAINAKSSENIVSIKADDVSENLKKSEDFRKLAESYVHGGTGIRENEDADSSMYYYEQTKEIYDNFSQAGNVTGVKGNSESVYRTGNINITKSNIGLDNVENKSSESIRDELTSSNVKNALGYTPLSDTGNAVSATKLQSSRFIDGLMFDGTKSISHYVLCETSQESSTKIVDATGYALGIKGARIIVNFKYGNVALRPVLQTSSNMIHPIYYGGGYVGEFGSNTLLELVFDGTRWNVVGELCEAFVNQIFNNLDTLMRPTLLYQSTLSSSALNTWAYASIPNLENWEEVRMWIEIGDADMRYNTFTRASTQISVSGYANNNYNGIVRALCDFDNNRIGLLVRSVAGWTLSNLRITRVEGLVKH